MPKIKITLPDSSIKEHEKGVTGHKIAELDDKINGDAKIRIITFKDKEGLDALRHSLAHLLAAAVLELWPDTKRTIGPPIENGFYYDFQFSKPINESDLEKIERSE